MQRLLFAFIFEQVSSPHAWKTKIKTNQTNKQRSLGLTPPWKTKQTKIWDICFPLTRCVSPFTGEKISQHLWHGRKMLDIAETNIIKGVEKGVEESD